MPLERAWVRFYSDWARIWTAWIVCPLRANLNLYLVSKLIYLSMVTSRGVMTSETRTVVQEFQRSESLSRRYFDFTVIEAINWFLSGLIINHFGVNAQCVGVWMRAGVGAWVRGCMGAWAPASVRACAWGVRAWERDVDLYDEPTPLDFLPLTFSCLTTKPETQVCPSV